MLPGFRGKQMGIGGIYANEVPDGGTFESGDSILVARGPYVVAVPKEELPSGTSNVLVENTLTSNSITNALSANQGRVLNLALDTAIDTLNDSITQTNINAQNVAQDAENSAKAYADGLVVGLLDDRGNYDPTFTALYPTEGGSGLLGAVLKGDLWAVSVDGTINSIPVTVGDTLRALVDNPAQSNANWAITQNNLIYVPENTTNKATSLAVPDNVKYPTTQAVVYGLAANLDVTVNTQIGTNYTLQTVDNDGKTYLRMNNATANTVIIPSTQTKPISVSQRGAGATTLSAGAGVTLIGDLTFTAQHQTKTILPIGGSSFDVVG